jgi:hypothetical protein
MFFETDRPETPNEDDVAAAREALSRPHDDEDADGTTRDVGTEPDTAEGQP